MEHNYILKGTSSVILFKNRITFNLIAAYP